MVLYIFYTYRTRGPLSILLPNRQSKNPQTPTHPLPAPLSKLHNRQTITAMHTPLAGAMKPTTREEHNDGVRHSFMQALLRWQRQDLSVDSQVAP
jgi:hypothetical protein